MRVGADYSRPPVRLDPWVVGRAELEAELARSRNDLASTLAARLSFGGPVAEELIARAGARRSGARVDPGSRRRGTTALHDIGTASRGRGTTEGFRVSPRWIGGGRHSVRVASLDRDAAVEEASRSTFSQAAHEYFRSRRDRATVRGGRRGRTRRRGLERLREQQTTAIATLSDSIRELQGVAETIFAHYPEAEAALGGHDRNGPTIRRLPSHWVTKTCHSEWTGPLGKPPRSSTPR